ncbi:DUF4203 domain-containing protein [Durusdinium trenchii]|uniref:DUF4203 domain-containing protein n=1 Tax=Durusdinium trenchii TaxID=1381693 RepID=A0ABP0JT99_9DINO
MLPWRVASSHVDCDGHALTLNGFGVVLGLLLTFQGHWTYEKALGGLLCLVAFSLEALLGMAWLQSQVSWQKQLAVGTGCLLWTALAGLAVWMERKAIQRCLAFFVGFLFTGAIAMVLLLLLDAQLSHAAPWRFLGISVALQLSLASGIWAASASQVKYLFILVTSLLGSAITVACVGRMIPCVHVPLISGPLLQDVLCALLVCLGLAVQITFGKGEKNSRQIHADSPHEAL